MILERTERLFVAPDFQRERAVARLRLVDHRPHSAPAALFVESRGAVVPDGTCEPGRFNPASRQTPSRIIYQCYRIAGAARLCADEKLVELVILDDAEAGRLSRRPGNTDVRQRLLEPRSKTFPGPYPGQLRGHEMGVGITPC